MNYIWNLSIFISDDHFIQKLVEKLFAVRKNDILPIKQVVKVYGFVEMQYLYASSLVVSNVKHGTIGCNILFDGLRYAYIFRMKLNL